jgi:hypothetical protein
MMGLYIHMAKEQGLARSDSSAISSGTVWATTQRQVDPSATPNRFRMEPAWMNLKSNTVHTFLTTQATTLADGAVFIIGVCSSLTHSLEHFVWG